MANLTNLTPGATFANLLNFPTAGQGVTGALQTMQDGNGMGTALQLSSNQANILGTLTVAGAAVPSLTPVGTLQLPTLAADPAGVNGMMYYNTTANQIHVYVGGLWKTVTVS